MFKTLSLILISFFALQNSAKSQDLLKERIWKLAARKKSVYLDRGVFHSDSNPQVQKLKSIRNSYVPSRGYERVVLDFSGANLPRVYGHISNGENKVYIDLFNVTVDPGLSPIKNEKYLENVKFFDIEKDHLSIEFSFNTSTSYDIFYLSNPARLVLDIKK